MADLTPIEKRWGERMRGSPEGACLEGDAFLELLARGRRSPQYAARMKHIASCPACKQALRALRETEVARGEARRFRTALSVWTQRPLGVAMALTAAVLLLGALLLPRSLAPPEVAKQGGGTHPMPPEQLAGTGGTNTVTPPKKESSPTPRPEAPDANAGGKDGRRIAGGTGSPPRQGTTNPNQRREEPEGRPESDPGAVRPREALAIVGNRVYEGGRLSPLPADAIQRALEASARVTVRGGTGESPHSIRLAAPLVGNVTLMETRPLFRFPLEPGETSEAVLLIHADAEGEETAVPLETVAEAAEVPQTARTISVRPQTPLIRGEGYRLRLPDTTEVGFRIATKTEAREIAQAQQESRKWPLSSALLLWHHGRFADAVAALEGVAPRKEVDRYRRLLEQSLQKRLADPASP